MILLLASMSMAWGESFHFSHRWNGEPLRESIKRREHFLALELDERTTMSPRGG
uniref:Uncharacterized protein n=1 Tax=Aegilops tauschii subsp. strangulata TaxID=200361 RepID=A0A453MYM1_AEGTS